MDPWKTNSISSDVITIRICRALVFLLQPQMECGDSNELLQVRAREALPLPRALWRQISKAHLNDQAEMAEGPVKITPFHALILAMGYNLGHVYKAAETSPTLREFVAELERAKPAGPHLVLVKDGDGRRAVS